jgi:retinol-binding protein 3
MNQRRLVIMVILVAAVTAPAVPAQQAASPPEPSAASAGDLTATVKSVAAILRDSYVFPDLGQQLAADILSRLEGGEYDGIGKDRGLADRLTDDLRAISNDKHLGVIHSPRPRGTAAAMAPRSTDDMRRENYYFRKVEVLQGNVGYLRLDLFLSYDEAKDIASAALAFLAYTDALIIDLRRNGGGSPDMIRYITSYFFDEPTLLNIMLDRNGEVVDEYHTLESVPGRRFAADLPIYVLTSSSTFSGAEEFAYNLKHLKRATIIGETTGGGAHPTRSERVDDHFVVRVPFLRARNPISGTNWEGTGIKPHIEVSADEALDRALLEARKAVLGERSLQEAGWPTTKAGAAAAAFFEAYGDDDAMAQFSKKFRSESAREGRSDAAYAAFWREFAEAAVPSSYVSRGDRELTAIAYITRHDGREDEATFRFDFDPEPPHGLRAINVSTLP